MIMESLDGRPVSHIRGKTESPAALRLDLRCGPVDGSDRPRGRVNIRTGAGQTQGECPTYTEVPPSTTAVLTERSNMRKLSAPGVLRKG